jgi:hypothetical protein
LIDLAKLELSEGRRVDAKVSADFDEAPRLEGIAPTFEVDLHQLAKGLALRPLREARMVSTPHFT